MKNKTKSKGFSLIELLIVITIMGLLVSIVAPEMFGKVEQSKAKTAEAQMKVLGTALDAYRLDMGYYPEKIEELVQNNDPMWHGPYIKEIPQDPWRVSYAYSRQSLTQFELKSYGADGKPGGEKESADIIY